MKFVAWATGALVVGALAAGTPAGASSIDLSSWTCAKYQTASKDEVTLILAWLDGYYREEDDPAVIDTDKLAANGKKLSEYCSANADSNLITATDKVFSK